MMSLSEWLEPIVKQIGKPVMDAMRVSPPTQNEIARDVSVATSSVILGRGTNFAIDYFTDGWFSNLLKLAGGILTSLAGIGAYAKGNRRLGQEALFTSVLLTEAWVEDLVKNHVKITASLQSTIEAARKGDVGRIGMEMVNKNTLIQLSKLMGVKPKSIETYTPPSTATPPPTPPPIPQTAPTRRKVTGIR